jgi:hypothetical protein
MRSGNSPRQVSLGQNTRQTRPGYFSGPQRVCRRLAARRSSPSGRLCYIERPIFNPKFRTLWPLWTSASCPHSPHSWIRLLHLQGLHITLATEVSGGTELLSCLVLYAPVLGERPSLGWGWGWGGQRCWLAAPASHRLKSTWACFFVLLLEKNLRTFLRFRTLSQDLAPLMSYLFLSTAPTFLVRSFLLPVTHCSHSKSCDLRARGAKWPHCLA